MLIRIEPARSADAPVIAEMIGELLHEIMAAIGSRAFAYDAGETESRVGAWIADRTYTVLLAFDGEAAMGLVTMCESRSLYAAGVFGTIPELYVRPVHRSRGVGARLVAEAKHHAGARGWIRLEVTTPPLPQFDRTRVFYERQGFSVSGGRKMKVEIA